MTADQRRKYNAMTLTEIEQQIAALASMSSPDNGTLEELGRLRLHLSARRIADAVRRIREA